MTDNVHLLPTPSTSPLALSRDGAPIPIRWVEDLFARLSAILGGAMSNVYASADPELVKSEWAEALAGFSAAEVKRGIAATRTRKFAPNLGEFLHLCRPALDPELGWIEAEKGLRAHNDGVCFDWSHPAVYGAATAMAYEIRSTAYAHVRKRWDALLTEQFALGRWPAIPDPTAARVSYDRAVVQQNAYAEEDRERIAEQLRKVRLKLTGFATKAEQDEQLDRAEAGALLEPRGTEA